MQYEKIALIGIGNIMFHDEGLGAYAVEYIKRNYEIPKSLTVLEGGTLGFGLMTYYQEYDKIIVVGTGSHSGRPGDVFSESAEEILEGGSVRKTANEVEITMMIEICTFHEEMGEVHMITMVPKDIIEVKTALTPEVMAKMPKLIDTVLEELCRSGISLERKSDAPTVTLEEIIDEYANPRQQIYRVS